jgi:hypothetical protein
MEGAYRLKRSLQVAGCIPAGRGVEEAWEGDYKQGKFFITNQVLMRGKFEFNLLQGTQSMCIFFLFFRHQCNIFRMGFEIFDVYRTHPDIRDLITLR